MLSYFQRETKKSGGFVTLSWDEVFHGRLRPENEGTRMMALRHLQMPQGDGSLSELGYQGEICVAGSLGMPSECESKAADKRLQRLQCVKPKILNQRMSPP
jgi:hypothetical protein